jgi:uncharacterized protein with GYD domain
MHSYVVLANWTEQGDILKRAKAFRTLIESHGGKLREQLYTLGEYDIIMVAEFPDDDTAAAAFLDGGPVLSGNVRAKTMRAFTVPEMAAIIQADEHP